MLYRIVKVLRHSEDGHDLSEEKKAATAPKQNSAILHDEAHRFVQDGQKRWTCHKRLEES